MFENRRMPNGTSEPSLGLCGVGGRVCEGSLSTRSRATANQQAMLAECLCTPAMDRFWADYIASFAKHDWLGS